MASLGQLSAGIAHELNNPAGFVYGNVDILRDYVTDLERLLKVYDEIALPCRQAFGKRHIARRHAIAK